MIHAKFDKGDRSSRILFDIPLLSPSEDFLEMLADKMRDFEEAVNLTKTLRLGEEELPELSKYSDGIQLSVTFSRVPRDPEKQFIEDYVEAIEDDLLELHDIFQGLVRDAESDYNDPLPEVFVRHG